MSCNITSPVNIPTSASTCSLKCNYSHNYPSSELYVVNKNNHISLKMPYTKETEHIMYGGNSYDVEEIRIYRNSLHKYTNEPADAEMIIIHKSIKESKKLFVCIPFVSTSTPDDNSLLLDNIVNLIGKNANSTGQSTNINITGFNLNKFIPNSPYIIYQGTQPDQCAIVDYIVFRKQNAIKISSNTLKIINNIIKQHDYTTKPDPIGKFFYNRNGPSRGTATNEDIYIECNPTGSDGELIVPVSSSFLSMNDDMFNVSNTGVLYVLTSIIGIILMYSIFKLINAFFTFINPDKKVGAAAAAAAASAVANAANS